MLNQLDDIVWGDNFKAEMSRFIPMAVQSRTLQKDKFIEHLFNENKTLLEQVKRIVESDL